jgi:hypothetical protein
MVHPSPTADVRSISHSFECRFGYAMGGNTKNMIDALATAATPGRTWEAMLISADLALLSAAIVWSW